MSSNEYSACLTTSRRLRLIVLRSGHLFAVVGAGLISQLPAGKGWLWAGSAAWAASVFWRNRHLRAAWAKYTTIFVYPDGCIELVNEDGDRREARLEDGSLLLSRVGWLRLSTAEDGYFTEPITGVSRRCNNWRRLQVIWRHIGASR